MKHDSILKIVDISHNQVSKELLNYLKTEVQETYTDRLLDEHIYNPEDIFDELQMQDGDQDILNEMEVILGMCSKYKSGYFRIIFN